MKFKVDENLPVEVADLLRKSGFNAVTIREQGMSGSSDDDLAKVCLSEGRCIITLDLDFADLRKFPPEVYPGIIVLRLSCTDKVSVLKVIKQLSLRLSEQKIKSELWVVDEERIRIRKYI